MKFLLGRKLGMTRIFREDGKVIPVTLVEAGPVKVTQIKNSDKDGYEAVQIGYGKKKKVDFRWKREYRTAAGETKIGDTIDVTVFHEGDKAAFTGVSKGKGFQGVVKRHGFAGFPKTHGTKEKYRAPGAIGSRFPQHVRKGTRMAGRMGQDQVSRRNVEIVKIDKENNLLALKGPIPGARGTLVEIRG